MTFSDIPLALSIICFSKFFHDANAFTLSPKKCGVKYFTSHCINDVCNAVEPDAQLIFDFPILIALCVLLFAYWSFFHKKMQKMQKIQKQAQDTLELKSKESEEHFEEVAKKIRERENKRIIKNIADKVSRCIEVKRSPLTIPAQKLHQELMNLLHSDACIGGFIDKNSLWDFLQSGKCGDIRSSDFNSLFVVLEDVQHQDVDLILFFYFLSFASDVIPNEALLGMGRSSILLMCAECIVKRTNKDLDDEMNRMMDEVELHEVFSVSQKNSLTHRLSMIAEAEEESDSETLISQEDNGPVCKGGRTSFQTYAEGLQGEDVNSDDEDLFVGLAYERKKEDPMPSSASLSRASLKNMKKVFGITDPEKDLEAQHN